MPIPARSRSVRPAMTNAAALARGTPVALDTNGTVRDDLGLASRTHSRSSFRASWMLSSPRTSRARAMLRVMSSMPSSSPSESVGGGMTHEESPE